MKAHLETETLNEYWIPLLPKAPIPLLDKVLPKSNELRGQETICFFIHLPALNIINLFVFANLRGKNSILCYNLHGFNYKN